MFKFFSILLLIAFAAVGVIFYLNNVEPVSVDVLFASFDEVPLGLVAGAAFIAGGLFGLLAGSGVWAKVKLKERAATKKLRQSEKELDGLRSNVSDVS